jgi:hypothetical protein
LVNFQPKKLPSPDFTMPEPLKGSPGAAGTGAAKEELRATAAHGLAVDVEYDI